MATTIKLKNGSGAPSASDLVQGEPAIDLTNKRLYTENSSGAVIEVGSNPSSLSIAGTAITATAAELNILDGVTSTAAELNILDGVTATAAELNILDGVTSTTAELNILDGVTSTAAELNILDGVTSTAAELNILDGVTSTTAELNILDGVTSTTAELNILDGVTSTAAELNVLDGVTAFVDEDDMSSDSATSIPSQQSVKAYVDSVATASDLDFQADSGGALSIDLDSETMTFTGGAGVDTSGSGNAVTFAIDATVATLAGSQELTNKTLTSPVLNTGVSGTAVLDEDDMSSDSATQLATQQSIKAYVDSQVASADTLAELTDTNVTSPSDAALLFYDTGTSKWIDNVVSGDITIADTGVAAIGSGVIVNDDVNASAAISVSKTALAAGTGLTLSTNTLSVDASQTQITAVGTIGTGTWQGSVISDTYVANDLTISGGTIENTIIGAATAAAGTFTTFTSTGIDDNATSTAITIDASENVTFASKATVGYSRAAGTGGIVLYDDDQAENRLTLLTGGGTGINAVINQAGGSLNITDASLNAVATFNDGGNVGIGTASPDRLLHVSGGSGSVLAGKFETASTSGSMIVFKDADTTTNDLQVRIGSDANDLVQYAGGSERLRIDSSGNVGIGTTSPANKLNLNGNTESNHDLAINRNTTYGSNTGMGGVSWYDQAGSNVLARINAGTDGNATSSRISFDVSSSGVKSEAMRIDGVGNVGIGTASAGNLLHIHEGSSAGAWAHFTNTTTSAGGSSGALVGIDSNEDFRILQYEAKALALYTSATERMRISSSGNVGIGTTSPNGKLDITGSGNTDIYLNTGNNSGDNNRVFFGDTADIDVGYLSYDHGTNVMSFGVNASERMRIDSSGDVLVNTTTTLTTAALNAGTTGIALRSSDLAVISRDGGAGLIVNRKTSDGDLIALRKDGTTVGSIDAKDGTMAIGTGDTGLRFISASDAVTPHDMNNNAGRDNAIDLGTSGARFDDIYATNATIQTSDANEKQDIEALSEAETRVAVAAKALLRKFRWKSAVEEKGDEARIHFGIIAQDLKAAFEAEGLDAGRYAMFIHSTWTDEETGEERSRMGVRYSELLAFIIAAI
jgi:hypothetical protein